MQKSLVLATINFIGYSGNEPPAFSITDDNNDWFEIGEISYDEVQSLQKLADDN